MRFPFIRIAAGGSHSRDLARVHALSCGTHLLEFTMKIRILSAAAALSFLWFALSAMAGDTSGVKQPLPKIFFVSQVGTKSERASILASATKSRIAQVQAQLRREPKLVYWLRAHGVEIRNIIARERAWDGREMIYVK